MTSPVSPSETIAKAMEGVTPGPWDFEPVDEHSVRPTITTIGDYRVVRSGRGSRGYDLHGVDEVDAAYIAACNPVAMREVLDELSALRETALQLEAMQREMAELRSTLAGDHEVKPLSEDRLEEILEFEERFKMLGGAGDTASLDWSTQRALIDEAVLACRARTLIQGEKK